MPPNRPRSTRRLKLKLLKRFEGRCQYCGTYCLENLTAGGAPVVEHMTPLSRGGTNSRSNLTLSCARCDHLKGPLTAEMFRMLLGLPGRDRHATVHRIKRTKNVLFGLQRYGLQGMPQFERPDLSTLPLPFTFRL